MRGGFWGVLGLSGAETVQFRGCEAVFGFRVIAGSVYVGAFPTVDQAARAIVVVEMSSLDQSQKR
jgi:hypothetical protein